MREETNHGTTKNYHLDRRDKKDFQMSYREIFERDGFVIIEDFFDESFMAQIDEALETYIKNIVPALPSDRVFYEQTGKASIKSMSRMNEESAFFEDFKNHPRIVNLAAEIFNLQASE